MQGSSRFFAALVVATAVAGAGCGSDTAAAAPGPPGFVITISNLTFSPANLAAPPGATVTVVNRDAMLHSVTQEVAPGAFTLGAPAGTTPFDTGLFQGTSSFTLPSTLATGTVLYYYCRSHTTLMTPANATITIDPSAVP